MGETTQVVRFDWFIKRMLRDKADYKVLEGFLSALLKKDVTIVSILESEGNQENENDKYNRVDVMVEDDKKEKIIIEIQTESESDYLERLLYGTSKVITDYMKKSDEYKKVSKVISISIQYFNLGSGDDYIYYGSTEFYGVHTKQKLKVKRFEEIKDIKRYEEKPNIFPEYYLINVQRFDDIVKEDIDEWIYMLKNSEIKKEFKSKYIKEAEERLTMLKMNEKERKAYDRYLMDVAREKDIMNTARLEGIEKGMEKGMEKGREQLILKQYKKGLGIEYIADINELDIEYVKKIVATS
jgi:predicted transposase/invertase (TIGR01784 family)